MDTRRLEAVEKLVYVVSLAKSVAVEGHVTPLAMGEGGYPRGITGRRTGV